MFVKYVFSKNKRFLTQNQLYTRCFSSNQENPKPKKASKDKEFEIVITPKKILIGTVLFSWIFIMKKWIDAEEKVRNRAQEYYDQGGSVDVTLPEEYRKEYADKLKRKMNKKKEKDEGKVSEITVVTGGRGD